MSDENFSEKIMIYKPCNHFNLNFEFDNNDLSMIKVNDLISLIKQRVKEENLDVMEWVENRLNISNIYIKNEDTLLSLLDDKTLLDIFDYFNAENLEILSICVWGGASIYCDGYKFVVHPDEDIHKFTPHVHVKRDDEETRYFLDTLKRFPNDNFSRMFQRDEKKKIIPFLKKNQNKLLEWWDFYMNGYATPIEDEMGRQYYKES